MAPNPKISSKQKGASSNPTRPSLTPGQMAMKHKKTTPPPPPPPPSPPPLATLPPLKKSHKKLVHLGFHPNSFEERNYLALSKLPILSTKFCDDDTLSQLGIKDDVHRLLKSQGWSSFLNIAYPTSPHLTIGFSALLRFVQS